jgi:hypothetical protein
VSKVLAHYAELATVMYKTRGARLHAAIRLRVREKFGTAIIAYLSLYLVCLSLASVTFSSHFTQGDNQFISLLTTVVSLAVVVFALLEYASGLGAKSERLHANALEISSLMRQLEAELVRDPHRVEEMDKLGQGYERAIAETYINHSEKDFKKFILSKRQGNNLVESIWFGFAGRSYAVVYWLSELWLHVLVGLSAPAATLLYFLYYRAA